MTKIACAICLIHFIHFKELSMERRTFLRTAALSTLAAVSISPLSLGQNAAPRQRRQQRRQQGAKKIPISVQVYSVRNAAAKDLAAALEKIAKMGYEGVEFAGYYGKDAKEIRKMLDANGLKCSGTHTGIDQFRGDNFEKTAELHKTLGTKFMIVPGGIDHELHDVERSKRIAEEFNKFAEKAKPFGLSVGYHAHGGDAKLIEGIPAWERLFDATVPEVIMQMDVGNYMAGGGDPYKMIEKFKRRSKTVHIKETGQGHPIVGEGDVDWERTFKLCETVGGTEWYVVEDEVDADNFDRIEKCIAALRNMGK
jgi:sugar phosphate isomerase/epimerase